LKHLVAYTKASILGYPLCMADLLVGELRLRRISVVLERFETSTATQIQDQHCILERIEDQQGSHLARLEASNQLILARLSTEHRISEHDRRAGLMLRPSLLGYSNALSAIIRLFLSFSPAEQDAIRRDLATLLPLISAAGAGGAQYDLPVLYGFVNAVNPVGTVALIAQTLVVYLAIYLLWRLVYKITRSLPNSPGSSINNTIVLIDILGLEVRLPLERCATFEVILLLCSCIY
jgi:hypothetical protein